MKLYEDRKFRREHENFIWRRGNRFGLYLTGFNISENRESMYIDPVYHCLLHFTSQWGYPIIETPWVSMMFADRYPFILVKTPEIDEIAED
jgi:hypothetical protein